MRNKYNISERSICQLVARKSLEIKKTLSTQLFIVIGDQKVSE